MPIVSIVIPIYNMGKELLKHISYLINQTYSDIEIILVDDGSTDDTNEICTSLAEKDTRIKVIRTINQGSGKARNCGIENASGRYIYFPDADDFIQENAIEILVNTMEEKKCDLVVFGFNCCDQAGALKSIKTYDNVIKYGVDIRNDYYQYYSSTGYYTIQGAPWNKFFDLRVIKKNNICFPDMRRHQDEAFIARYVDKVEKVCFIEDILYTYYVNDFKKVWDKFPITYMEIVNQLYKERCNNILIWNSEDEDTHDLVYAEYTYNLIKALELSFSPKYGFTRRKRLEWIKQSIKKSRIEVLDKSGNIHFYQRILSFLIKQKRYITVYYAIYFKICIEKCMRGGI